jgi:DNA invertase Pin-like site-specific DNA recombinase
MKSQILELRKLGFSYNEISKKLNCSKSTISYHCSKLETNDEKIKNNVKLKNKKQEKKDSFLLETDKIDVVISLRKALKNYKEIKKETGLSIHVISKICKTYNLVETRKYGAKILKNEQIEEVNKLYNDLKSERKVSKKLGLSRDTVRRYIDNSEKRKRQLSKSVVEWRKRTKIQLVEYKGGECEKCGYKKCIDALEFHHKDPNEKDFTISGKSWSFERLKKEADKCILVCSNCHKEIHFELKFPGSSEAEQTTKYDK